MDSEEIDGIEEVLQHFFGSKLLEEIADEETLEKCFDSLHQSIRMLGGVSSCHAIKIVSTEGRIKALKYPRTFEEPMFQISTN